MRWLIPLFFLSLSACMTPQQKYERMESKYGSTCEAYGFKPDTDPYRQCLLSQRNHAIGAYGVVTK